MLNIPYRLYDTVKNAWTRNVKVAACEQHEIRTLIVKFVRRQKSSGKLIVSTNMFTQICYDRAHIPLKLI